MLVFHLKHVWMDITDLIAFICAPILTLVDGVWRGHVSVQKKTVTQKPDVEVVRNICSFWLFSFLSLTVVFITILIFLFKKNLPIREGTTRGQYFCQNLDFEKKIDLWLIDKSIYTLSKKNLSWTYPDSSALMVGNFWLKWLTVHIALDLISCPWP